MSDEYYREEVSGAAPVTGFYDSSGRRAGFTPWLLSWIFSLDHKRIAILYLVSTLSFFAVGVSLGFLIRLELIAPGATIVDARTYNAFFTLHGVIMIFLFIIPVTTGVFGNFLLPIQIGAKDMAFPRLNLLSWWFYIIGAALVLLSLFTGDGLPDTGWTFYVPYSLKTAADISLTAFALFILGFSSILTGINFVTTVHKLRAPGMRWHRLPLFVWSIYSTAWILVIATPVLGMTLLLVIAERTLGLGIFDPVRGGDPILYQHLFWIYSHPAVYVMILPGMGIVAEIIPVFTRRVIFGYRAIAYSSVMIAVVGSMVWGHHMFVSGFSKTAAFVFSLFTFLVAIPSAIKVFNWISSLYRGSIVLEAPFLLALVFIFQFTVGGLTGLILGTLSVDVHLHDTTFVVGHFHYMKFGGGGFAFFAGLHYWFPKIFGRMYIKRYANIAVAFLFVGFNTLYFPMLVMGYKGMPRRYFDYLPEFQLYHVVSTVGSWILITGLIIMFVNLIYSIRRGEKAGANPWGGATIEWQTTSPPPVLNFVDPPVVDRGPYDYR